MRACLASGGYTGRGWRTSLACCTLPPTRMRCGTTSFLGGGGGGRTADGTAPMIPPRTPPVIPPATPPATPPTTPPTPEEGGGSSSSLISAICFGMLLGAISRPASNWRGMTFTFTTGATAGGGGGGGGGGGATRKL